MFFFCPNLAKASSLILDEINIVAIQDMHLRKEKGAYYMDVVCKVQNAGKYTLKFQNCKFDLSFALRNSENIRLGSTFKEEALLKKSGDTDIQLATKLGSDIEKFHFNIISSEELSSLLMEPHPKLNLGLQGDFILGIQFKHGWMYQKGIKIDWILPVDVPRDVFVRTYKAIESAAGKGSDLSDDDLFKEDDELFKESE
ncbi:hypothetical protein QUF80_03785 [Desulfococcaceae bacterium HSG8]|nr:hypothetical protein [Desulfococcaceae bacterium HSG8]